MADKRYLQRTIRLLRLKPNFCSVNLIAGWSNPWDFRKSKLRRDLSKLCGVLDLPEAEYDESKAREYLEKVSQDCAPGKYFRRLFA